MKEEEELEQDEKGSQSAYEIAETSLAIRFKIYEIYTMEIGQKSRFSILIRACWKTGVKK